MKPEKILEYKQRLKIAADSGDSETIFHTENRMVVAMGYNRVVIGDRGPYIELLNEHILFDGLYIPKDQHWRFETSWREKVYYFEFRTIDDSYVKVYLQNRRVSYADYIKDRWYISPFELMLRRDKKI